MWRWVFQADGYSGGPTSSPGHWLFRGFWQVLHLPEMLCHRPFVSIQMCVISCLEYSQCSQQPATCCYPEPDKSSPHLHPASWEPFSYSPLIYVQVFQVVPFYWDFLPELFMHFSSLACELLNLLQIMFLSNKALALTVWVPGRAYREHM